MNTRRAASLVKVEYDLVFASGDVKRLIRRIAVAGLEGAGEACRDLRRAERLIVRTLRRLADPINAAVNQVDGAA